MLGNKEDNAVMENKRPTPGHVGAQYSILKNALSKLLTLCMSLLIAGPVMSAVIGINASKNPENVIEVTGDLEASVEYTASGLRIEIPGVSIKLTCDGVEVSEQAPCTIDLGQGDGSSVNPPDSGKNPGGSESPKEGDACTLNDGSQGVIEGGVCTDDNPPQPPKDGDACTLDDGSQGVIEGGVCSAANLAPPPKDGDACTLDDGSQGVIEGGVCTEDQSEGKYDSFCAAGRNPAFAANPVKFDEVCNPDGTVKDGVDNTPSGGGFELGGGDKSSDDNCGSQGYDPTCTAGGPDNSADTAVPFPQGAQRVVEAVRVGSEILDFGSANRDAVFSVSRRFDVAKGKVSAIDFTLAPETSLTEYCANGAEVAPKFAGEWSDRCKDDNTPKTVADFCTDGPDKAPSFFGDWSNSCQEDRTPKPNATPPLYERLDPNIFQLTLAESGITAGGNVHLWISTQRDGERISEECSFIPRFPEGLVLRAGVGGDSDDPACRLEAGQKYYLMVAFCAAPEGVDDYNCTNPETKTALRTVTVFTKPSWRRFEESGSGGNRDEDSGGYVDAGVGGAPDGQDTTADACGSQGYDPTCKPDDDSAASTDVTEGSTPGFVTGTGGGGSSAGTSGSDAGAGSSASDSGHFSKLFLETPKESSVNSGIGSIQGWALDESGSFDSSVDFYIDGQYRGQIALGDTRRDVGSAYPSVKNSGQSGFSAAFNYGQLNSGWHELQVAVTDSSGKMLSASANFYVVRFSGESFLIGDAAPKASAVTSCRMVGAQIRCSGVSVSGVETTLWLEWSSATQNFEISRID